MESNCRRWYGLGFLYIKKIKGEIMNRLNKAAAAATNTACGLPINTTHKPGKAKSAIEYIAQKTQKRLNNFRSPNFFCQVR